MKVTPKEIASWPSGNYLNIATLSISTEHLESVLGCKLLRGTEAGLGEYSAIGIETSNGVAVELIQYENSPSKLGFTVRVDSGSNYAGTLSQLLADLRFSEKDISWLSSSING